MSAERRGAMPTRARYVKLLSCGHPVRSGTFTSSMTRPLGNHARKRNGTCQNRKPMRNGEAQALVTDAVRVAPCRVALDRPAEVLEGFEAGPTAGLNALKNRWLGRVAARVALERPAEALEAFEAGQTAGLNALKNRWLGRVAARVALERPAEGLRERWKRLRPGKRQA